MSKQKIWLILCCITAVNSVVPGTSRADDFWTAFTGGKIDLNVRYRYEHVDDDAAMEDANASTIRTTLGYTSGTWQGFGARILAQDVREAVLDDFNDATGRYPSRARYAVVADPEETDLLEGYASYTGIADTTFKLGRQIITYRLDPMHRFIGTVLWRQNWQNHDGFSVVNKSFDKTTLSYAYSWNVNRIFTDEAVNPVAADFDSNSHFLNAQYDGFKYGKIEGYVYLLDFDNAPALSTATYGIRFNGSWPYHDRASVLYTAEYARQYDYADNPAQVDEDYFLGEIGASFKTGKPVDNITLKFSYELLTGNGTIAFQTPLATGHAYQGWADRFLVTPGDGIEDLYFTAGAGYLGANLLIVYHLFDADNTDYSYGSELDVQLTKTFKEHYTFGFKLGIYDASDDLLNVARGGSRAADVSKYWAWAQIRF
jgi:hypothetical protein